MDTSLIVGFVLAGFAVFACCLLGWQLLQQNGRILLRLDDLEKRLDELEFGGEEQSLALARSAPSPLSPPKGMTETTNVEGRTNRVSERTVARSKIKRDGLKAGTPAPDFRLPRLDGKGDLSLSELRGKLVLLVFSSPGCGPCNELAPELEK